MEGEQEVKLHRGERGLMAWDEIRVINEPTRFEAVVVPHECIPGTSHRYRL